MPPSGGVVSSIDWRNAWSSSSAWSRVLEYSRSRMAIHSWLQSQLPVVRDPQGRWHLYLYRQCGPAGGGAAIASSVSPYRRRAPASILRVTALLLVLGAGGCALISGTETEVPPVVYDPAADPAVPVLRAAMLGEEILGSSRGSCQRIWFV